MNLQTEITGMIKENCYILTTEKAVVIIDPGIFTENIKKVCFENKGKEFAVLLTHSHFDHILGAPEIKNITGCKIMVGKYDSRGLSDVRLSLSERFHAKQVPFNADILLEDGDTLNIGDIELKVMHTPGHTVGGVCFITENMLFSGDTLFYNSYGRTDFYGGDPKELRKSLDKLMLLPDETVVYSGHGESTTILTEREFNDYKRYL